MLHFNRKTYPKWNIEIKIKNQKSVQKLDEISQSKFKIKSRLKS